MERIQSIQLLLWYLIKDHKYQVNSGASGCVTKFIRMHPLETMNV